MTDSDRPVYVAVRYVYHSVGGELARTVTFQPGTLTPKQIVDRAMHPSVARCTIWCPGAANPEPGPTDLDEPTAADYVERPSSHLRLLANGDYDQHYQQIANDFVRRNLTPGEVQSRWDDHYRRGMDGDYPEGGDVA